MRPKAPPLFPLGKVCFLKYGAMMGGMIVLGTHAAILTVSWDRTMLWLLFAQST
jgi:hypothetical protein